MDKCDVLRAVKHPMRLLDTDLPFVKVLANNMEYAGFERFNLFFTITNKMVKPLVLVC